MPKFAVKTELTISCEIIVEVEADDADDAIEICAGLFPKPGERQTQKGWKADVTLKPPKGVNITSCKAFHFLQASGGEKAKKII